MRREQDPQDFRTNYPLFSLYLQANDYLNSLVWFVELRTPSEVVSP